jgi:hypothetical protein
MSAAASRKAPPALPRLPQSKAARETERAAAEAAREQEAIRARNVRAGAAHGQKTTTDVETGKRTIDQHPDGTPVYNAGPIKDAPLAAETTSNVPRNPMTAPSDFDGALGATGGSSARHRLPRQAIRPALRCPDFHRPIRLVDPLMRERAKRRLRRSQSDRWRPSTYWHARWSPTAPHPHQLEIALGREHNVAGITYLPRQDKAVPDGMVEAGELSFSRDGTSWSTPLPFRLGNLVNAPSERTILLGDKAVEARFVRFTSTAGAAGKPYAAAAGIGVLPAEQPTQK